MNNAIKQQLIRNAERAFAYAQAEARTADAEMLTALQKAQLLTNKEDNVFVDCADRALKKGENWRRAAELAREVLQELHSGIPRNSKVCFQCGCNNFKPSTNNPAICDNGADQGVPCGHPKADHI